LVCPAPAHDTVEFDGLPPDVRARFFGHPTIRACCSEADGHRVAFRGNEQSGFEVLLRP
jgi:hypothetical protein